MQKLESVQLLLEKILNKKYSRRHRRSDISYMYTCTYVSMFNFVSPAWQDLWRLEVILADWVRDFILNSLFHF